MIRIVFPWSCAVSSNYRTAFHGGRHKLSPRYRKALENAHLEAMNQYRGPVFGGNVSVHLRVYPPDRRKRDAPNLAKLILDAMEGILYLDDVQVTDLRITAEAMDKENARIEATIERIDP